MKRFILLIIIGFILSSCLDRKSETDNSIKRKIEGVDYIMPILSSNQKEVSDYYASIGATVETSQDNNDIILNAKLKANAHNILNSCTYVFHNMGNDGFTLSYKYDTNIAISKEMRKGIINYLSSKEIN